MENQPNVDKLRSWLKAERGRLSALAKELGITHGAILQWDRVPSDRVVAVSRFTEIPLVELRPDLYPISDAA